MGMIEIISMVGNFLRREGLNIFVCLKREVVSYLDRFLFVFDQHDFKMDQASSCNNYFTIRDLKIKFHGIHCKPVGVGWSHINTLELGDANTPEVYRCNEKRAPWLFRVYVGDGMLPGCIGIMSYTIE